MRVGIIGTGPAGTSCAIALLRGGQQRGQVHKVLLFDDKAFDSIGPLGCNMCAGVISTTLFDYLGPLTAEVRDAVIQRYINEYHFSSLVGGVCIEKEPESSLCTVFRSAGPRGSVPDTKQSFDNLLLHSACDSGAEYIHVFVTDVILPTMADASFHIIAKDGRDFSVDVLVGAFGVNSTLSKRFEKLGFGYRRPKTYHACQAEFPFNTEYIDTTFQHECKIFSLALRGIRFGAIIPKRHHITVSVIGPDVKRVDLERFLEHPQVRQYFPSDWKCPTKYCHCHPQLPVSAARNVVSDRLIIIGDANVSRYLKGGIESAFFTGSLAAEAILSGKLTRKELYREYVRPCARKYSSDNRYGRLLFWFNDIISHLQPISRVGLWLLKQEQRMPKWEDRAHTRLLWHIFAGDAPYRQIFFEAFNWSAFMAVLHTLLHRLRVGSRQENPNK